MLIVKMGVLSMHLMNPPPKNNVATECVRRSVEAFLDMQMGGDHSFRSSPARSDHPHHTPRSPSMGHWRGEEGKDLLPHDQLDADIHGFAVFHAPGIQALRGHTPGPQRVGVAKVTMEKKLHLK